jgi:hypothetical protein
MIIIYACMICRNKSIMSIIYRFISLADSGKRNSVLHGAVYNLSTELISIQCGQAQSSLGLEKRLSERPGGNIGGTYTSVSLI